MISFPIRSGSDEFFLSVAFLVIRLGLGFHVLYLLDLKNQIGVRVLSLFSDLKLLLKNRGSGTIVKFHSS
jgi:hypothetical protein